ncbi:hypothetical protein ACFL1B_04425 [Nanoarchaeota archaeon]
MFGKKKKSRDEIIAEATEVQEVETEAKAEDVRTGDPKLDIELTKIKSQIEALNEVRKANGERFTRVSEQMGEVRGMITDISKSFSKVEVGATKAVDLVESVQPEKLMMEVRKEDAKVEATRAQLESVEARMKDMLTEVKGMREKMNVYKGLEQVASLNEEMKAELSEMRRMQVNIERHADRVESMFLEVNKKFVEFDKFNDVVKELQRSFDKVQQDLDKLKVKIDDKSDKKEFLKLINRFSDFEKHTDNVLKLLDDRSKNVKEDLFGEFEKIKSKLEKKYEIDFNEQATEQPQAKAPEKKGVMDRVVGAMKKPEEKEDRKIIKKPLEALPESTEPGIQEAG